MNRRQLFLTTAGLLTLTGAFAVSRRRAFARPPRVVTTKDSAYLIGKIEHVLAGEIKEVVAAPEGRYVLVTQSLRPEPSDEEARPFGEEKLWLYDARRRTTALLHRVQDDPLTKTYYAIGATWFPTTKKALITVTQTKKLPDLAPGTLFEEISRTSLGMVDAERKIYHGISAPHDSFQEIEQLPKSNQLLLIGYHTEENSNVAISFLSPEGKFTPLSMLPAGASFVGTLETSKEVLFEEEYTDLQAGKATPKTRWHALRIGESTPRLLLKLPDSLTEPYYHFRLDADSPLPLKLITDDAKLIGEEGRLSETSSLWLETTVPGPEKKYRRALVAAESDGSVTLLADLSAVLYTHDDALYAAPIASLDRLAFEKLMRQLALSNARQIGTSLMMYCQDYDEIFPHDPANVKDAILPYIKSNDTLADFVYTYKGPLEMSKLDKPAETELGYVPGPGGRAVIYADGHAKWEPTQTTAKGAAPH